MVEAPDTLVKLSFALITDPTCLDSYPAQARNEITLRGSQGNEGGGHDTLISHCPLLLNGLLQGQEGGALSPAQTKMQSLFSPPEVSFLGNVSHISGRETENMVCVPYSLLGRHGVSASPASCTGYPSLTDKSSLTEVSFVGYPASLLVGWVVFKIATFL